MLTPWNMETYKKAFNLHHLETKQNSSPWFVWDNLCFWCTYENSLEGRTEWEGGEYVKPRHEQRLESKRINHIKISISLPSIPQEVEKKHGASFKDGKTNLERIAGYEVKEQKDVEEIMWIRYERMRKKEEELHSSLYECQRFSKNKVML